VTWRRIGRTAGALALVAATAGYPPAPARAHTGDPNVHARVDAVTPELPGVTIQVRSGVADQLLLVNTTPTPVVVLDTKGVPFLRISDRDVEANVGSADWYLSNSPLGIGRQPPKTKATDWHIVSRTGSWGWFDHRLHDRVRPLTQDLRNAKQTLRLAAWRIPLRYGARHVTVTGHVEYRPVLGAFRTTVDSTPPDTDVDVLDGRVPGLFLTWRGGGALVVNGIQGEPFARLTSSRTEVNPTSETWQDDQRLRGSALAATFAPADPKAQPRWHTESATARLTWLDRRLAYAPGVPPDDVLRSGKPTTLVEWTVPVTIDGRPGAITGTTTWQPTAAKGKTKSTTLPYAAALLATAAAVGAAAAIRRRTARR
jgi:hypothetical protein